MNQVPERSEHTSENSATGGTEKRVHHAPANDAPCCSHESRRKENQLIAYHGVTIWRRIEFAPSDRFRFHRFSSYARRVPPDLCATINCGARLFRGSARVGASIETCRMPERACRLHDPGKRNKKPLRQLLCRRALAVRREAQTHTAAWLFSGRRQIGATS